MGEFTTERERYRNARGKLRRACREKDEISPEELEAIIELADAYDAKAQHVSVPDQILAKDEDNSKEKEPSTLKEYCNRLRIVARRSQFDLSQASADEINHLFSDMATGDHPAVKDSGLSANTINSYQAAVRRFYEYHDFGPEKSEINMMTTERKSLDENELLDQEDIQAMRNAIESPRDKCLFELLVYTGQRVRAIQTLRIKDVKPNEGDTGNLYLNTEAGGLKGAADVGRKRPLLGARGAVIDWLKYHPTPEDPDAYLLTHDPSYTRRDTDGVQAGTMLARQTINQALNRIADRAGIDKPTGAHQFRHYFVTVAKREYGLDDAHIKQLIGHDHGSRVMETTYSHLDIDEAIDTIEIEAGYKEPDESGSLTPPVCTVCEEPLADGAKACPHCGTVYTPDAQATRDEIEADAKADTADTIGEAAEAGDEEVMGVAKELIQELDDPDAIRRLADAVEAESQ